MQLSFAGLAVVVGLLLLDRAYKANLMLALLGSAVFGSTAFATLSSFGGASPQIYVLFCLIIALVALLRKDFSSSAWAVFKNHPESWIVLLLSIYVVAGAYISPRLFLGDTLVFVLQRSANGGTDVAAIPLAPWSGNITQALYFVASAAAFFGVRIALMQPGKLSSLRSGILGAAALVALTGIVDVAGRSSGFGDLLAPIRTATYAMMTGEDAAISGFLRVNGACSEASAYAAVLLPSVAFVLIYWRETSEAGSLALLVVLSGLLVISTSTTAYATAAIGLGVLGLMALVEALRSGHLRKTDLAIVAAVMAVMATVLAVHLLDDRNLAPFLRLIDDVVLNKGTSQSGLQRGEWNEQALRNLVETWFIGVGIGSSRISSWAVAVLSQLGIVGTVLTGALIVSLLRPLPRSRDDRAARSVVGLALGVRAAALACIISASLISSSPDPGVVFFVMLAAHSACRSCMLQQEPALGGRTA